MTLPVRDARAAKTRVRQARVPGARPASLAATIRSELEAKIISGEWPPGHRILSEHDLTRDYGCARMTVHKALSSLAQAGLIVRHRRAGSFVAEPQSERAMMQIQDLAREAAAAGKVYTHRILYRRLRLLRDAEAGLLGVRAGSQALHLRALHSLEATPNFHEDRIILLDQAPQAAEESFRTIPPSTWLLRNVPWNDAQHVVSATTADAPIARLLQVAPGAALLCLERRTWHRSAMVTRVVMTYPGARQRFVGWFSPAGQKQGGD